MNVIYTWLLIKPYVNKKHLTDTLYAKINPNKNGKISLLLSTICCIQIKETGRKRRLIVKIVSIGKGD